MSPEASLRLSPEYVSAIFEACQFQEGENASSLVEVEGIATARFHSGRLKENEEGINALLAELPDEFKLSGGGGWSFLNACMDRHGNQWTGMHATMEQLFLLGQGIGKVLLLLPRDAWVGLPGGMPYYVVKDK